jgi:hypothetical protein
MDTKVEDGCWYEPPSRERANRKKIKRWLRTHPRVTWDIESIMDQIYDNMAEDSDDAKQLVVDWLEYAEAWLRAFPKRKIYNYYSWVDSFVDGAHLSALARGDLDPKELVRICQWARKAGAILPAAA